MKPTRREWLQLTAAGTTASTGHSQPAPRPARRRTLYYNDARHYYLFVFEPPMRTEEPPRPLFELADPRQLRYYRTTSRHKEAAGEQP